MSSLELVLAEVFQVLSIVDSAEDVLIARCMAVEGFYYPEYIEGNSSAEEFATIVLTPSLADWQPEVHGYFFDPRGQQDDEVTEAPDLTDYLNGLSDPEHEAWNRAFGGSGDTVSARVGDTEVHTGTDGCLAEAQHAVAGSADEAAQLGALITRLSSLSFDAMDRVLASDQFVALEKQWQSCMEEGGYSFISPTEAEEVAVSARPPDAQEVSKAEIAQAVADKDCQASTKYPGEIRRLFQAAEADVINNKDTQAILIQWKEVAGKAASEASRILTEANSPKALTDSDEFDLLDP